MMYFYINHIKYDILDMSKHYYNLYYYIDTITLNDSFYITLTTAAPCAAHVPGGHSGSLAGCVKCGPPSLPSRPCFLEGPVSARNRA